MSTVLTLYRPEFREELREIIISEYLSYNRLYNSMGVTREQFLPYANTLLDRADSVEFSTAIALKDGVIVAYSLGMDLYEDYKSEPKVYHPKISAIHVFNDKLMTHFTDGPLFQPYIKEKKAGVVFYGLHVGTVHSYLGNQMMEKLVGYHYTVAIRKYGFQIIVCVTTHQSTVGRSMHRLKSSHNSIIVGAADYRDFEFEGTNPLSAIEEVSMALCEVIATPRSLGLAQTRIFSPSKL